MFRTRQRSGFLFMAQNQQKSKHIILEVSSNRWNVDLQKRLCVFSDELSISCSWQTQTSSRWRQSAQPLTYLHSYIMCYYSCGRNLRKYSCKGRLLRSSPNDVTLFTVAYILAQYSPWQTAYTVVWHTLYLLSSYKYKECYRSISATASVCCSRLKSTAENCVLHHKPGPL